MNKDKEFEIIVELEQDYPSMILFLRPTRWQIYKNSYISYAMEKVYLLVEGDEPFITDKISDFKGKDLYAGLDS